MARVGPRGGKWGDGIAATLRSHGAIPVIAPMVNFANPDDTTELSNALHELEDGQFDWLVITSATTVDVLVSRSVRLPPTTKVAAVGETTATRTSRSRATPCTSSRRRTTRPGGS